MTIGRSILAEIEREVTKINRKFSTKLVARLNEDNPLKTGLSRSNWFVDFFSNESTVFPIATQSFVRLAASQKTLGKDLTQTFYIINNINYIVDLAQGSSPQASRGWIDRAIVDIANEVYGFS